MDKHLKTTIIKNFFRIGFPSLLFTVTFCFFIFGNPNTTELKSLSPFIKTFLDSFNFFQSYPSQFWLLLFFSVILFSITVPLYLLYFILAFIITFFSIPIMMIQLQIFSFSGFMFELLEITILWSFISAFTFKLGKMLEDSSYVSGHHYEIEYNATTEKATAKKVDDYSGGGEWLLNILLFLLRMVIILFLGLFIFTFQTVKLLKSNDIKTNSDSTEEKNAAPMSATNPSNDAEITSSSRPFRRQMPSPLSSMSSYKVDEETEEEKDDF